MPKAALNARVAARRSDVCGRCHAKERELYATSVHGKAVLNDAETRSRRSAPITAAPTRSKILHDTTKLVITKNCGNCHEENFKSPIPKPTMAGLTTGLRVLWPSASTAMAATPSSA
jgi:cytochrome c553